tara:strand:+ start:222 stop:560 length:339 start_codon:yes stop_codon:yes gene_type:complete
MKDIIKYEDFEKLEILVGTVLEVNINKKAKKPAYILNIDFGSKVGKKKSSAQITNYSIEELLQKQIIAVCNFEKKNIAGVESEVLILGAINEKKEVILLHPQQKIKNGSFIC